MITTVTLNPAVDKTYTTARLIQGQVNRMEEVKNIAGGKGVNVAKVLRQYDCQVGALGLMGGYTGQFIADYMKRIGVQCHFTYVEGETRCSINILSQDGYVTELLEPGPFILGEELERFLQDFEEGIKDSEMVVLSGSAPAGVPADIYARLISMGKKQGKKMLLDSSGDFLKEGVKAAPFMIKPNVKELEALTGRRLKDTEAIMGAALALHRQGIPHVLVSMGVKGLLYVSEGQVLTAKAPSIKAVNTVGCGDCVVAAFAMGIGKGMRGEELLKSCIGISAANATTLENGVIPLEKADELRDKAEVIRY